jgi:acylphosphatase
MGKRKKIILFTKGFLLVFLLMAVSRRVFAADLEKIVQEEAAALAEARETVDVPLSQEDNQKVEQIQEEVEALIEEAEGKEALTPVKKGWSGEVVSVDNQEGVIVLLKDKESKRIFFDEETVFLNENRQKITPESLREGDFLVAMGYQERLSSPELAAKRILKSRPQEIARQSFFGRVSDVSQEEAVFSLEGNDGQTWEINAEKARVIKKEAGKGPVRGNFSDLKKGVRVVLVGEKEESQRMEAVLIYLWTNGEEVPSKLTEGVSEEEEN